MIKQKISHSVTETNIIGNKIGEKLKKPLVITLNGELGAGKTTFTKSIAKGLGVTELVKSPTFMLIKEYESGRLPLYHMDAYRLSNDMDDIGLDDYFNSNGINIVEWSSMINEFLPDKRLDIEIKTNEDLTRTIKLETVNLSDEEANDLIGGL